MDILREVGRVRCTDQGVRCGRDAACEDDFDRATTPGASFVPAGGEGQLHADLELRDPRAIVRMYEDISRRRTPDELNTDGPCLPDGRVTDEAEVVGDDLRHRSRVPLLVHDRTSVQAQQTDL